MSGYTWGRNWSEQPPTDAEILDAHIIRPRGLGPPPVVDEADQRDRERKRKRHRFIRAIFSQGIGRVRNQVARQVRLWCLAEAQKKNASVRLFQRSRDPNDWNVRLQSSASVSVYISKSGDGGVVSVGSVICHWQLAWSVPQPGVGAAHPEPEVTMASASVRESNAEPSAASSY